ncbi:MAG: hypothetical protein CMJ18_28245 [Phycisphaeraceae bacterium]|nr:hypothetical protein [Phycisphaeraceae bacterium]
MSELRLDLDATTCVIAAPSIAPYVAIAERLASDLPGKPRVADDAADSSEVGDGPVILLGNLMDSALVRRLYLESYDFTDYSWPSIGGYVVRTIRDPFGSGAHVVLLGGSDVDGVSRAADELAAIVRRDGVQLGYVNRVELGRLADVIHRYTQRFLADDAKTWNRMGEAGSWAYEKNIALCGLGYLRTGEERYLVGFAREFAHFSDQDLHHPRTDSPRQVHGFLHLILLVWDLIRDHPFFDGTRKNIDDDFLFVMNDPQEGPEHLRPDTLHWVVRDNHGTMSALDAHFGGRFFRRRFRHQPALGWMELAARYFDPQLVSAKPIGDHWGHQWSFSLFNTLVYALATGNEVYWHGPHLRDAADRALIAHPVTRQPLNYLRACHVATGDPGYLSGTVSVDDVVRRSADMSEQWGGGFGACFEVMRAFCTGEAVAPRGDLVGVAEAPMDDLWNDTIAERGFNPGHVFATAARREERFDKIGLREGWAPDDFFLCIDGISGGHHSFLDANCIKFLYERGVSWLANLAADLHRASTVAIENGVSVVLDGAGPGRLHRYARRLYTGQSSRYLACGTSLQRLGRVDWHRHIVRRRGSWTLVIDVVEAKDAGELLARRHWHLCGDVSATEDGRVSVAEDEGTPLRFHLQSVGIRAAEDGLVAHPVETLRTRVGAGQTLAFATLMHVTDGEERVNRLDRDEDAWRVASADGEATVRAGESGVEVDGENFGVFDSTLDTVSSEPGRVGPERSRPQAPDRHAQVRRQIKVGERPITAVAGGVAACGDGDGVVSRFDNDGALSFEHRGASAVTALHAIEDDLLVGTKDGALTCLGPDGSVRWRHVIEYELRPFAHMGEHHTAIREIGAMDLDGDGAREIVVFCSDRAVYLFDREGNRRWYKVITSGLPSAMSLGPCEGRNVIFGGTSDPSIHGWCLIFDADGDMRWYARDDLVIWSLRKRMCDTRVADVDGDGQLEVVNGLDTACRQLVVYRQGGRGLWDADIAGAARCVSVMPPRIVCGSDAGWVCAFDGKSGQRLWQCPIGAPTNFVGRLDDEKILAVTDDGRCVLISPEGKLQGDAATPSPVTALPRAGDHRDAERIVLGTQDGHLLIP